MWKQIATLPGVYGPVFIEVEEPLVPDEMLQRIPDHNTRQHIRQAIVDALAARDVTTQKIASLHAHCLSSLKNIGAASKVAMMHPKDQELMTRGWQSIATLCEVYLHERAATLKVEKQTEMALLERWLVLRQEAVEGIHARHQLGAFEVDGGIIKPRSGVPKP